MVLNKYYLNTHELECTHCGHKSHTILVDESNPRYIKAVCGNCRQYLKFLSKSEQGHLTPPLGTYRDTGESLQALPIEEQGTYRSTGKSLHTSPAERQQSLHTSKCTGTPHTNIGVSESEYYVDVAEESEYRDMVETLEELLATGVLSERYASSVKGAIAFIELSIKEETFR